MNSEWVVKALSGTVTRGVLWAIAGICAYLSAKGIEAKSPDEAAIAPAVTGIVAFVLPILASWWSQRKDKRLLTTDPPTK